MNLYFVMVPTHRNPEPGRLFDFKWRRRFSRPHDEVILVSVAMLHSGYTFLPPSEGAWMRGLYPQVEGMRPFLFTAGSREQADIITDLVCAHYKQEQVMAGVWAHDVEFRDRRDLHPWLAGCEVGSAGWNWRVRWMLLGKRLLGL